MPRCTPAEHLIDPCLCRLIDCQIDASERGQACREEVVALRMADAVTTSQGLVLVEGCSLLETLAKEICVREFNRCKGKEESASQPHSPLSDDDKAELQRTFRQTTTTTARVMAVVETIEEKVPNITKPLRLVKKASKSMGIAVAGMARISAVVKEMADDPPDPNFGAVPRPVPPKIPLLQPDPELGDAVPAGNDLIVELARAAGLSRAMSTAINRFQGAVAAGDNSAQSRQLEAARQFARDWAEALSEAASRRTVLIGLFSELGVGNFAAAMPDVIEIRHRIITVGWPKSVSDRLAQFGLKGQARKELLDVLTVALHDVQALTRTLKELFVDAPFLTQERKLAKLLSGFSSG